MSSPEQDGAAAPSELRTAIILGTVVLALIAATIISSRMLPTSNTNAMDFCKTTLGNVLGELGYRNINLPDTKARDDGGGTLFAWNRSTAFITATDPRGDARELDSRCVIDRRAGKIIALDINGQSLITP